ncbi:MAG: nitronate monooxygenase [Emcibacter sp.]|nr:nitronate monooxygenase [Emcibacter sp.]
MASAINNRFTETYGTKYPFACAALAFVGSTPDLATAVCNMGAVGTFAAGKMPPPAISGIVATIRSNMSAKSGPLNINMLTIFTDDDLVDCICELKPEIVSFHWGAPEEKWVRRLKEAGIKIWEQIGSAEDARKSVGNGSDAVIAQGQEAGGHNLAQLPLSILIPEVVDAVGQEAMVLAAGGISDGRSVAAALCLGADAVYVGSRFVASREANAHADYKQRIVDTVSGSETVLTNILGRDIPEFNPLRILENDNTREWHGKEKFLDGQDTSWPIIGSMPMMGQDMPIDQFCSFPPVIDTVGNITEMALSCGQGAGLIHSIDSVDKIITDMMDRAVDIFKDLSRKCNV